MTTEPATDASVDQPEREHSPGGRLRLLHYPPDARPQVRIGRFTMHVRTYRHAVALPVRENVELTRFHGAVYTSDGDLVGASQRAKPGRKYHRNAPHLVDLPSAAAERLAGRTFFAGQLAYQFGHVLLESLPRFWPALDYGAYDNFVVYPNRQRDEAVEIPELLQRVLALVGVRPERIRAVTGRPLVFDSLDVAVAPLRVGAAADPRLLDVFDRVARQVASNRSLDRACLPRLVYLSRSRLDDRRRATNESAIEAMMIDRGFAVVHPQDSDLEWQVALAGNADVLAGCDGSALHLAAFARPGCRVLALDTRSTPNQFLLEQLRSLDAVHAWVAADRLTSRVDTWTADLRRVADGLDATIGDRRPGPG